MTISILATVPLLLRELGGSVLVSTPTSMASIFTANILLPGKVWSGLAGKDTATPLNELR